jgi:choline-sulfatase
MTPRRIILVLVDTLRADCLGCYGDRGSLTANIDRLATRGVRFESAYSASNFTAPAVASLFTSLYPAAHGVYDFRIKKLPPARLMEVAARNGFFRKAVVDFGFFKSYLGRSFDDMESLTDLAPNWSTEGPFVETRRAVEWISKHKDESFFLFLHISPTHAPYRFPQGWYERIVGDAALGPRIDALRRHPSLCGFLPVPDGDRIPDDEIARFSQSARYAEEGGIEDALVALIRDLYRQEVRVADEAVGMLAGELERLGIFDATVLSVSSDHGEELWDHGSFGHGAGAMYNEVVRTPWIITYPERIRGGAVVTESVSQTNVLPTILDIAGVDIAGVAPTGSVKRLASREPGRGAGAGAGEATPVFSDTSRWISVVRSPFKMIAPSRRTRFPGRKEKLRHALHRAKLRWTGRGRAGVMLYDLRSDPGERSNIASRETGTVKELLGVADRYYKEAPSEWLAASDLTAAEEEQVRKELDRLGYL